MKMYVILEESDDSTEEPHLAYKLVFWTKTRAEEYRKILADAQYNLLNTWIEEMRIR